MEGERPRPVDTSLVRGIAALLIINSHSETLYPYRWMADGGQLGIAIFFVVAGIGTAASPRTRSTRFARWYLDRLARIYPSIWMVVGGSLLLRGGLAGDAGFSEYTKALVYPVAGYTFFAQIIPFYFIGFLVVRSCAPRQLDWIIGLIGVLCIGTAIPDVVRLYPNGRLVLGQLNTWFWWCCYLGLYLLGIRYIWREERSSKPLRPSWVVLAVLSASYVALKLLMVVRGEFAYAFPLLWIVVAVWSTTLISCMRDPRVLRQLATLPRLNGTLIAIGGLSLETFLLHEQLLHWSPINSAVFPVNILLLLVVTLLLAWPIAFAASRVRRLLVPLSRNSDAGTPST